ncbi:MAG: TolB family protein [Thermoleophilaceae bacterium]
MSLRVAILFALAAALCVAAPAQATFKGANGRVAYDLQSAGIGDNGEKTAYRALATVQADSRRDSFLRECQQSGGKRVDGDCSIQYRTPSWRPDGRQLVFDTGRSLALIGATGGGYRALPAITADDSQPAFAPSGRKVVFAGASGGHTNLYVYDLPTGKAKRIVINAGDPDWSSRNRIAFERRGNLYSVAPNGKGLKRITRSGGRDPGWSASGKSIVFARRGGIYTASAEGKGARRIVRCSRCASPVFSPNGKLIAYDRPGVTVAQVKNGRTVATLLQDVSAGGESVNGSNPSWGRR